MFVNHDSISKPAGFEIGQEPASKMRESGAETANKTQWLMVVNRLQTIASLDYGQRVAAISYVRLSVWCLSIVRLSHLLFCQDANRSRRVWFSSKHVQITISQYKFNDNCA